MQLLLFGEPSSPTLKIEEIRTFLHRLAPSLTVHTLPDFFTQYATERADELAPKIASLRVKDPSSPVDPPSAQPLPLEIQFEKRNILNPHSRKPGILYDGFLLAELLQTLLPRELLRRDRTLVIFTILLLGTYDENDLRYHARTIICSSLKLISTTGLVVAPAKPPEYYLAREAYRAVGLQSIEPALRSQLGDRILHLDDPRLTEVAKGYVLQALAHQTLGYPFCNDPNCRLYNAHRQEELLHAQLRGTLCPTHTHWFMLI